MKAIAAVAPNWGIGDGTGMLYRIPGALKFFRSRTAGHTVIMGRRTLESLPGGKPLPKRRNIVLTRDRRWHPRGVYVCHSIRELLELLTALEETDPFVIGGGEIYRQLLPYCDSCILTRVDQAPPVTPSVFFPDLAALGWHETVLSEPQEENGYTYRFTEWRP